MTTPALTPLIIDCEVLVTGGAGFIGSHLVERLLESGARRVRILDDLSTGSEDNLTRVRASGAVELVIGSTSDANLVARTARGCDLIFHLASSVGVREIMTNRMRTLQSGAVGVMNILEAARQGSVPVIFTSTSEVYGESPVMPLREDARPAPGPSEIDRWGYAAMKLFGEYLVLAQHRERGTPAMAVRLFNTVGPRQAGQYGMVLPRFVAAALAGEPLTVYGDGSQTRCFTDVSDVTEAILRLSANPAAFGHVVNVGGCQEISILELARRVIAATGSRSAITFVPYSEVYGPSFEDIARRVPDVSRLTELTGLVPQIPLDRTIARVVAHMRAASAREPATA